MLRKHIVFLLLAGIPASGLSDVEMPVSGKKGEGLAEAIRVYAAPCRLPDPSELTFVMTDRFEGREISVNGGILPDGYTASGLVCPDWWSEMDVYGDTVLRDLANYYPVSSSVSRHRADLPPGSVATPTFETPLWCAGTGMLGSIEAAIYSPPAALRGRLARTYFYMAVMYPQGIMRPKAYTMFTGTPYPALTAYARGLLIRWHRDNPPGEDELELCRLMEALQGNVNPFVTNPEFVEYLWGDKAGEVYEEPGKPVPLHSAYGLGDTVYFTTPCAPPDASWSVDGRAVTAPSMPAATIGAGAHDVVFTSALSGTTGRVMIKIE